MTESTSEKQQGSRLKRLAVLLVAVLVIWVASRFVLKLIPPAPLTLAREAVETGQFDVAVQEYMRHLNNAPEDWGARLEVGTVLATFDRPQALNEFRKIPPDSEAFLDACEQITMICLASGREQEAEQAMLEIEAADPNDWSVRLNLAELYFRQGSPAKALPFAQRSSELNPENKRTHFLIAELLDDLQRPGEMIEPLKKVLDLDLDDYAAHLNLSYAYSEAGEAKLCREEAEWCLARRPSDIHAMRFRAMALRDEGMWDEALAAIEQAVTLAPLDLECRLVEAELLLFAHREQDVLDRLEPLYEYHQNDRRLAAILARAAAAVGESEKAAVYRQQVQKLSE